jgi:hydrogenase maturation protease
MRKTLVIGYGNTLRSDDGVGVWVADRIASLHLSDVDVRTCHQLYLELAADMIQYDVVIIIDASASGEPMAVRKSIPSPALSSSTDHNVSPEILQRLALDMYGVAINAHVYTVRGECFEFGTMLSAPVKERAMRTIILIASLLQQIEQRSMEAIFILN